MGLKDNLKKNKFTKGIYVPLRKFKNDIKASTEVRRNFKCHARFENRQKGYKKLCIVLAGYKSFLYDNVFARLKKYLDEDIDVCIITSGIFSKEVQQMCKKEGWSYLSTKENNVSLVQNVSIKLHPKASWIYKLDEDIFITENYFKNMMRAYKHASLGFYNPGVIAPLIPINGYGHIRILEKNGAVDIYTEKFEKPKYLTGPDRSIEGNPEAAKFMWGDGGVIPSIDEMNNTYQSDELEERVCAIRFSIGAILFERSLWEEMGYFKVVTGAGMGEDEIQLSHFCTSHSRPIMVSENIVVGHLSFGVQNESMKEYYLNHTDLFGI